MNVNKVNKYRSLAWSTASSLVDRPNKHVSMIFLKDQLVAIGINSKYKTHPLARKYGYLFDNMHSELAAWLQVRHMEHQKMTLVNWHFNNRGQMKLAKPCDKCLQWVLTAFHEIWYTTPSGLERF